MTDLKLNLGPKKLPLVHMTAIGTPYPPSKAHTQFDYLTGDHTGIIYFTDR